MIWTQHYESVEIDLGGGKSVEGNSPYLVSGHGSEIKIVGGLGDGIDVSWKSGISVESLEVIVHIERLRHEAGLLFEVNVYRGIDGLAGLEKISPESLRTYVKLMMDDISCAIRQNQDFFLRTYNTQRARIVFLLSSSKRWTDLANAGFSEEIM